MLLRRNDAKRRWIILLSLRFPASLILLIICTLTYSERQSNICCECGVRCSVMYYTSMLEFCVYACTTLSVGMCFRSIVQAAVWSGEQSRDG